MILEILTYEEDGEDYVDDLRHDFPLRHGSLLGRRCTEPSPRRPSTPARALSLTSNEHKQTPVFVPENMTYPLNRQEEIKKKKKN